MQKKWLALRVLVALATVILVSVPILADTGADITVTAVPRILRGITDFTITYVGETQLDFSWVYEAGAVNIMIRGKYGSYPDDIPNEDTDPSDGYLVYYGSATTASDTTMDFDENPGPIYYKAWGQKADNKWFTNTSTGWKESFGMTTVAIALIVLVFTILAFWRKDPLLYMLGVIGWLFMTFFLVNRDYPAENAYLPYAIAVFCLSVTLVMVVQALRVYFSGMPKPRTSSEIQAEHRKKVLSLTKRKKKSPFEDMF